jgi:hypothetical protein
LIEVLEVHGLNWRGDTISLSTSSFSTWQNRSSLLQRTMKESFVLLLKIESLGRRRNQVMVLLVMEELELDNNGDNGCGKQLWRASYFYDKSRRRTRPAPRWICTERTSLIGPPVLRPRGNTHRNSGACPHSHGHASQEVVQHKDDLWSYEPRRLSPRAQSSDTKPDEDRTSRALSPLPKPK